MKQTIEERKLHHQTREDRQRKVYDTLQDWLNTGAAYSGNGVWQPFNVEAARRDAANLARKLGLDSQSAAA